MDSVIFAILLMRQRYFKKVFKKNFSMNRRHDFVNNIAEIVHSMVDRFQGAANKNIGDAFLLVWKMN